MDRARCFKETLAPNGVMIQAWPSLTALGGEPAMTVVPSFVVAGILTIIFGALVAVWAGRFVRGKNSGLFLIMLSLIMLLVGGGIVPPMFGVAAGIIAIISNNKSEEEWRC